MPDTGAVPLSEGVGGVAHNTEHHRVTSLSRNAGWGFRMPAPCTPGSQRPFWLLPIRHDTRS